MFTETADDNKLNEYKQRYKEWRDVSVNQLSNVNNILVTLSTGLLALGLKSEKENDIYCLEEVSFILLTISICYGIAVLFSRLYDFRISRHIVLTRQRFYNTKKKEEKKYKDRLLPDNNLGDVNYCDRIKAFLQILFCKINFITKDDIKIKPVLEINNKFNALRRKADILGKSSWIWTKYQVLFFLLSAVIYLINQLIKF